MIDATLSTNSKLQLVVNSTTPAPTFGGFTFLPHRAAGRRDDLVRSRDLQECLALPLIAALWAATLAGSGAFRAFLLTHIGRGSEPVAVVSVMCCRRSARPSRDLAFGGPLNYLRRAGLVVRSLAYTSEHAGHVQGRGAGVEALPLEGGDNLRDAGGVNEKVRKGPSKFGHKHDATTGHRR